MSSFRRVRERERVLCAGGTEPFIDPAVRYLVSWGLSLALPLVLQAEAPDTLHVLFS